MSLPGHLAVVAVLVVCVVQLTGCMAGCSALSPFAYPHSWDFTRSYPKDAEIVGTYKVLKLSGSPPSFRPSDDVQIILYPDHTAQISGIPDYDAFGETRKSTLTGKGTWQLQDATDLTLEFYPSRNALEAPKTSFGNVPFWVLGQHAPYRLYYCIGDPDNDTGIEFQRK